MTVKSLVTILLLVSSAAYAGGWSSRPLAELAAYPGYSVPATVHARDEARISAEVAGRIEELAARVGQAIDEGAVLAHLDDRSHRIEVRRARAALSLVDKRIRLAESQLARSERLADENFVSDDALKVQRTELEVLSAEREAAVQALAAAQLELARTTIRAPFDGVVRERLASVGELAAPGTALLILAATDQAEIRAAVPIAQLAELRAAERLLLAAGGREREVRIVRVSGVVDTEGQTREVVLRGDEGLPPGLAGELRWRSPLPHLPAGFLQLRGGHLGAFVIEAGEPVFVPIDGAEFGRPAAVDWPLTTEVVDEGRLGLESARGR
ncbi:MAG: efflux RND transporter periplasmic adaptor subunit [Rhodocyclaceae bacterium]|nr:efflux RND transporter periplasmic adaptor subunit [Rhodocyclaceae bacterium]